MQYINYETDIVQKYGVILEGWTHPTWANPSELSTSVPPLQTLVLAIKNGTCKFRTLTKPELEQRQVEYAEKVASGEIAVKKKRTRSDKGTKRKRPGHSPPRAPPTRTRTDPFSEKIVNGQRIVVVDTNAYLSSSSSESDSESSSSSESDSESSSSSSSDDTPTPKRARTASITMDEEAAGVAD